jgi:hypothetical protein
MFKHGILKYSHGKIIGLITGSKEKHGRSKPRWIQPDVYEKLLELQKKLKVDATK